MARYNANGAAYFLYHQQEIKGQFEGSIWKILKYFFELYIHFHHQCNQCNELLTYVKVTVFIFSLVHYENRAFTTALIQHIFHLFQGCILWFLCHPGLVCISIIFDDYQRNKVNNIRDQIVLFLVFIGKLSRKNLFIHSVVSLDSVK